LPPADAETAPPYPESLCHGCAAPPRYVTSDRGTVFLFCPIYRQYPPQPVLECLGFVAK
jgi:hypothetical protein